MKGPVSRGMANTRVMHERTLDHGRPEEAAVSYRGSTGAELADGVWMQGRSLTPRLLGQEDSGDGPTYARSEAGYATEGRWQKIVRDERYKLIYAPYLSDQRWIGGGRDKYFALFDLTEDPAETVNLADERPEILERLQEEMIRWWKPNSFEVLVDEGGSETPEGMTEETRRQLEALGYLQ